MAMMEKIYSCRMHSLWCVCRRRLFDCLLNLLKMMIFILLVMETANLKSPRYTLPLPLLLLHHVEVSHCLLPFEEFLMSGRKMMTEDSSLLKTPVQGVFAPSPRHLHRGRSRGEDSSLLKNFI